MNENKYSNNEVGKKQYDAAMDGSGDNGKGVHMYERPYLWRENNPVHAYADTPCENFVPTPTIHTGEDSKVKKVIKIGLLVALAAFMIYALIAQIVENSGIFAFGEIAKTQFF